MPFGLIVHNKKTPNKRRSTFFYTYMKSKEYCLASRKRTRLAYDNTGWHVHYGYFTTHTGTKVLAVESPRAAYFMASKLSRPHKAIEGRATYAQVAHSLFESKKDVILDHLHNHVCCLLGILIGRG